MASSYLKQNIDIIYGTLHLIAKAQNSRLEDPTDKG